jgi:agmatine deiminase
MNGVRSIELVHGGWTILTPRLSSRQMKTTRSDEAPCELGYSMPAEWERHEATWLGWPHNATDWPGKLGAIRWVYGEMVRKITECETVRLLVRHKAEEQQARRYLALSGVDLKKVQFIAYPTDRGWMRDSGPIFVRKRGRDSSGRSASAIVHFHFNAWAKYNNWKKDRRVPELAARLLGKRLFDARVGGKEFVIEGGGIDVNGRGTLLTTEECYLHPRIQVRNPGMSRSAYEECFRRYLGVKQVVWLANGPVGDDTHGHIDDICRFVNPTTLVLIKEKNRRDANFRALGENWERVQDVRLQDGRRPEVVPLPMPSPLFFDGYRLPASYANFYICNAAVLVPTFNDPNDRVALGTLGELFKDRPVVGIHAVDLVLGFGTLHCLTQQQPV